MPTVNGAQDVTKKSFTALYLNSIINLNFVERFVNSESDYHSVLTHPLQNKLDPKMIFGAFFFVKFSHVKAFR